MLKSGYSIMLPPCRLVFYSCVGAHIFSYICIVSNCFVFPASGLRDYPSGVFWGVGIRGYSWSSSSTGTGSRNSGNLNTGDINVNPLNNNNRTNGFAVRCVQELTGS